ncbi:lasso peptide biosynthesis PqqD family chaperone [Amycolatopsis sp. NPDC059657]|uniref:lasso peptide biosynthesis PqqD family chaperone n=1 Tax=Amycolatopsis sp. NPDC059657 TaxID=3346899 RepID=UPI003670B6A4
MPLRIRADVSIVDTEYGSVLLDERKGRYFQLNPSGALVVRSLLDGGSAEQAIGALVEEYDVAPPQARRDVTVLLDGLRSAGLVTS